MFVNTDRVAISEDGENIIFIKPKMNIETKNCVMDDLVAITGTSGNDDAQVQMHMGAYSTALLVHNVVDWVGPAFAGVKCIPQNIRRLDPDEPLVAMVLDAITQRNPIRRSPDPKSPATANGSTSAGGPSSEDASSVNTLVPSI